MRLDSEVRALYNTTATQTDPLCIFQYAMTGMDSVNATFATVNFAIPGNLVTAIFKIDGTVYNGGTGYGLITAGTPVTLIANPTPEPSTFVLLALGAFGLLAYAWSKRKWT